MNDDTADPVDDSADPGESIPLTLSMDMTEFSEWTVDTVQLALDLIAMTTGSPVNVHSAKVIGDKLDVIYKLAMGNRTLIKPEDAKQLAISVMVDALRILDPSAINEQYQLPIDLN